MSDSCAGVGYVIREGDTLYKISRRFRIPLPTLLRANLNVDVYNLIPGQKICIPLSNMMDDMENIPPCWPIPDGMMPPGTLPPDGMMPPRPLPPDGMMPPRPLPPDGMMPPQRPMMPPMNDTRPLERYEDSMMFTNEINATRKHITGENETIEMIMDMYNVSIEDLFKYNNRNGLMLKEDQIIHMP